MEETLGKRIIVNRKRLNMTQDRLAEQLGVTAQAVSKWENDQSCPDISMLPKLAELFGISIDTLLGVSVQTPAVEAEVVESICAAESEPDGIHFQKGNWEFHWDNNRKSSIGLALWILLVGGLLLAGSVLSWDIDFWDVLWPAGLLVFGLCMLPGFSFFRLGCLVFGAYFLLGELELLPFAMGKDFLFPAFLLLFGASLLADAVKKPGRYFSFTRSGKNIKKSHCNVSNERFECTLSFGEKDYCIDTPRLRGGEADVSFGDLEIDLSGCEEIVPGCTIDANCSFGELTIKVPRRYRVEPASSTSFGNFEVKGSPDPVTDAVITLEADASFGEICVKYI
ncbi:MAG: helix-turn-helix transcriptional regulator [Oscillospiraceae bacterium]|nr:helix-turn-helix transcriptional regulator [Oscillospiraceae bacterium]